MSRHLHDGVLCHHILVCIITIDRIQLVAFWTQVCIIISTSNFQARTTTHLLNLKDTAADKHYIEELQHCLVTDHKQINKVEIKQHSTSFKSNIQF